MNRWFTPIDLYCERTDPSFWAEPLNAWTNAAFLLAAAAAFIEWRRGGRDYPVLALIGVTVLIGFGSFIFHTFATRGAALFDVIPIAIFIYGYLLLALRRFVGLATVPALLILAAFAVLSQAAGAWVPRELMNGSHSYLPALAALLVIAALVPQGSTRRILLGAAGVFMLSIVLRTVDLDICDAQPLGTHFLWHSLNGLVLYLLLRAAISDAGMRASRDQSLTNSTAVSKV